MELYGKKYNRITISKLLSFTIKVTEEIRQKYIKKFILSEFQRKEIKTDMLYTFYYYDSDMMVYIIYYFYSQTKHNRLDTDRLKALCDTAKQYNIFYLDRYFVIFNNSQLYKIIKVQNGINQYTILNILETQYDIKADTFETIDLEAMSPEIEKQYIQNIYNFDSNIKVISFVLYVFTVTLFVVYYITNIQVIDDLKLDYKLSMLENIYQDKLNNKHTYPSLLNALLNLSMQLNNYNIKVDSIQYSNNQLIVTAKHKKHKVLLDFIRLTALKNITLKQIYKENDTNYIIFYMQVGMEN